MIFEVKCYGRTKDELTDRTHTRIVSFIVLDYHQEALRYYNIGTLYTRIIIYLFFLSKVSSSPVIQMKQSWHSECDMS